MIAQLNSNPAYHQTREAYLDLIRGAIWLMFLLRFPGQNKQNIVALLAEQILGVEIMLAVVSVS